MRQCDIVRVQKKQYNAIRCTMYMYIRCNTCTVTTVTVRTCGGEAEGHYQGESPTQPYGARSPRYSFAHMCAITCEYKQTKQKHHTTKQHNTEQKQRERDRERERERERDQLLNAFLIHGITWDPLLSVGNSRCVCGCVACIVRVDVMCVLLWCAGVSCGHCASSERVVFRDISARTVIT